MKAVQIKNYTKTLHTELCEVPLPTIGDDEVLVKVMAAAVNPLELLIMSGSVKLIQNYKMPLTLGNECAGVVEKVGRKVRRFKAGDRVYARLPLAKIGAFAEYVAITQTALAKMPAGYEYDVAAAIPLTGLTAYQGLVEELSAQAGETLLIPGGSGSLGQMAVPIAKALGLHVIVTGNARAKERTLALGADEYLDYRQDNYWEKLSGLDMVMDTLGPAEFEHELSVLRKGGRLLSLRTGPNRAFAIQRQDPALKKALFSLAGFKYDKKARQQGKTYRFMFVRADGAQLEKVTEIVEKQHILPAVDPHRFTLAEADDALQLVANGRINGKVILRP